MERLMNEMVAMILQLNIEHYQRLLAEDIDESQRKTIPRLFLLIQKPRETLPGGFRYFDFRIGLIIQAA
jgi:hypothetical protein